MDQLSQVNLNPRTVVGREGFFRVGQSDQGRWWFVTPQGKPFFYKGVTSINSAGLFGGRRAERGPYADTIDAKYGDMAGFVTNSIQLLRSWHFNALGAWTEPAFFNQGMPFTEILDFTHHAPLIDPNRHLPDVFDPEWEHALDAQAKTICSPLRDSRDLVGYFTDNELGWSQPNTEDVDAMQQAAIKPKKPTLLQMCLSAEPNKAAFRAAWDFVMARHDKSLAKVGASWEVAIESADSVKHLTAQKTAIDSKAYRADCDAFTTIFARRYFQSCANAIRRYDPNHMILGCRFGGPPGPAVLSECKSPWVDVISANNYRTNMAQRVDIYYRLTKTPVLITEFSWASAYFRDADLKDRPDEQDRVMLQRGIASLEEAFAHPGLVGYTWYRWVDKPARTATTRPARGMSYWGLVDLNDNPKLINTIPLTTVNARAESVASGLGHKP